MSLAVRQRPLHALHEPVDARELSIRQRRARGNPHLPGLVLDGSGKGMEFALDDRLLLLRHQRDNLRGEYGVLGRQFYEARWPQPAPPRRRHPVPRQRPLRRFDVSRAPVEFERSELLIPHVGGKVAGASDRPDTFLLGGQTLYGRIRAAGEDVRMLCDERIDGVLLLSRIAPGVCPHDLADNRRIYTTRAKKEAIE